MKKSLKIGLFVALGIVLFVFGVIIYKKQKKGLGSLKKVEIYGYDLYSLDQTLRNIKKYFNQKINVSKYDSLKDLVVDYSLPALKKFFSYPKEDEKMLSYELAKYCLGHTGNYFETSLFLLANELKFKN